MNEPKRTSTSHHQSPSPSNSHKAPEVAEQPHQNSSLDYPSTHADCANRHKTAADAASLRMEGLYSPVSIRAGITWCRCCRGLFDGGFQDSVLCSRDTIRNNTQKKPPDGRLGEVEGLTAVIHQGVPILLSGEIVLAVEIVLDMSLDNGLVMRGYGGGMWGTCNAV